MYVYIFPPFHSNDVQFKNEHLRKFKLEVDQIWSKFSFCLFFPFCFLSLLHFFFLSFRPIIN